MTKNIKKFKSIISLLKSEEFRNRDLSYCDLSGVDLSKLPSFTWKNFKFNHTNFTDTYIKFKPQLLAVNNLVSTSIPTYSIEYCDFTNCNLSYLKSSDFLFCSIKGCNFTNTDLNIELTNCFGENIKESNNLLDFKDYSDVIFPQNGKMSETILNISNLQSNDDVLINYKTVQDNPNVFFTSDIIYLVIKKELIDFNSFIPISKAKELRYFIDDMLNEDGKREGKLISFFNILNNDNPFTDFECIRFFQGNVENKSYGVLDLSNVSTFLINSIIFSNCKFEKIIFSEHFEKQSEHLNFGNSLISHAYFPTITYSSWKEFDEIRLGKSMITIYRNLYLELGRSCNGKCKFCRNQLLEPCTYDLSKIIENLSSIPKYFDNIVIGGGEPTLRLDDLEVLYNQLPFEFTIFTNGSLSFDELYYLSKKFDFNISRHSVSDDINNNILGVKALSSEELKKLQIDSYSTITLCATCFKGDGLDTVEKIEDYISFAYDCGINRILFQTLHRDLDNSNFMESVLPIDDGIFDEVIMNLKAQKYKIGVPIYSTGNYKLIIADNDEKSISFKKYITNEELEREWPQACKRTFDLSMDPSGNLYENWHQSLGKVLIK